MAVEVLSRFGKKVAEMRIAKEKTGSLKAASTTKGRRGIPVTAKNASQQRGRTGMKSASGHAVSSTARKTSSRKGGGK
jgi:hypothetical protein